MAEIQSASEYKKGKQPGKIGVVYSTPDAGKSSLLLTLTQKHRVLYMDVEGMALDRFEDIPDENKNIDNLFVIPNVKSLEEIDKLLDSPQVLDYDVLVVDSISNLVGLMTAHANPAKLAGNNVFGYYRDLGRYILFIMEKAKDKGVNVFFSFHGTDQDKNNKGVWMPKSDGKEIPDRIEELSSLMIFLEKKAFGERTVWLDTANNFALTKSKLLPADHPEKMEFKGMENFSLDYIMGGKMLPKRTTSKCTPKQADEIAKLITAGNKLEQIDMDALCKHLNIEGIDLADISEDKAVTMIGLLVERNADVKEEQRIAKKGEAAKKKPSDGGVVKDQPGSVLGNSPDEPATAADLKMEEDA